MWWFKHELQFITTDPPWIHSSSDMHAYDVCQIFIENEFITVSFHRSSFHATLPLEMLPLSRDTSRTTFRRCSSICSFLNSLHCSRPQGFDVLQEIRLISHPSSTTGFPELESYEKTCSLRSLMVLLIGYKNITTFKIPENFRKFPKIPEIRSSNQCSWRILCPSHPPTFQPSFDAAGLPKLTVWDEVTWTASRGALQGTSISHPRKGKLIFPTTYEEDSSIVPKEDMWKLYVPSTHIIYANL